MVGTGFTEERAVVPISAHPLLGFLGRPSVAPMAMAFSHIALAAWLLVKGFLPKEMA